MSRIAAITGILGSMVMSPPGGAGCPGVTLQGQHHDARLEAALRGQLSASVLQIRVTMRQGDWQIAGAEISGGDKAYAVFKGAPRPSPPAYVWSGSAELSSESDIRGQLLGAVKGLPRPLASCFARYLKSVR